MTRRTLTVAVLIGLGLALGTPVASAASPTALVYRAEARPGPTAPLDGARSRERVRIGLDGADGVTSVRYEGRGPGGARAEVTAPAAPFEAVLDLARAAPGAWALTAHVATAGGERAITATVTVPPAAAPRTPAPQNPAPQSPAAAPAAAEGTAARAFDWGAPAWADEFDGGAPERQWALYNSAGNGGNGLRRPAQVGVGGGVLTQTGTADAASAGMVLQGRDAADGRWEVRARAAPTAGGGQPYHPVVALIPIGVPYNGGERDIDFVEGNLGTNVVGLFVHHPPRLQDYSEIPLDMSAWHTFAVEVARDHVTWFVDGTPRITDRAPGAAPTTPMALNVQLDANAPRGLAPATLQLDWARYFRLPAGGPPPAPAAPAPKTVPYK